jgi:hypothetical protein
MIYLMIISDVKKDKNTITIDDIKYLFKYIDIEIWLIKYYAKYDENNLNKLSKVDIRMCICVCFQRYKFIFDDYKVNLNIEDESNYLDEYLTEKKLNLKTKKYSFNYCK